MDCVNGLTSWLDCFDTTFHTMSETFCHFLAETKDQAQYKMLDKYHTIWYNIITLQQKSGHL